jgi:NAD(P)H dehydrogenase (quinone)
MPQTVVVVTFYSRSGETERLATAAAVGAVQARAGIRMRRLPDADPNATLARYPQAKESLERMHTEYVPPKEADILAADALILGLPADVGPSAAECSPYFQLLMRLHAEGKLAGKAAAAVGTRPAVDAVTRALAAAGLSVVPAESANVDDVESAIALGRQVVAVAESLKRAQA